MSFLLGRSQQAQQQQQQQYSRTSSNSVLFNAGSDDEDNDDELEAAFGDSDARELQNGADYRRQLDDTQQTSQQGGPSANGIPLNAYRPEGHSHAGEDSIAMDDHDTENDRLLHGSSGHPDASGSRSHSPRPRMTTAHTGSSSHTSTSSPGGYDFEADPYERRSAPISLGVDEDEGLPSRRRRQTGGRAGQLSGNASSGLLATIRNVLPSRFRHYGVLNTDNRSASGRRTDGTIDHDDGDEDDENWIAPPPSMPGIYGGGSSNDGVFANMAAKPGNNSGRGERSDIVGGDDDAPEKEIPPVCALHFAKRLDFH